MSPGAITDGLRMIPLERHLGRLFQRARDAGVVIEYVPCVVTALRPGVELHRAAAVVGMGAIAERQRAKYAELGVAVGDAGIRWDESRCSGSPTSFDAFWGSDDVEAKPTASGSIGIPDAVGYKTAFFHPPYGLRGRPRSHHGLFARINELLLGPEPRTCEIYAWSTDWSSYFDSGRDWWGTFYWTVHRPRLSLITAIGASASD